VTFLRRLLPFVMLLFAAGCSAVPETVPAERSDAVDMMSTLSAVRLPEAFSAEGSISVSTPTMEQSAGFEMIARGDDSVKMSIFGPFGITVGTALFIPGQFTAYSALNNTVYRGSPERQLRSLPFVSAIPFEVIMGTLPTLGLIGYQP
jgi:outer membrane biogenesis lipoprotein LolB